MSAENPISEIPISNRRLFHPFSLFSTLDYMLLLVLVVVMRTSRANMDRVWLLSLWQGWHCADLERVEIGIVTI